MAARTARLARNLVAACPPAAVAVLTAACIVAGLPLAAHLAPDLRAFDPARPPDPATFRLAPSIAHDATRPDGS